MPDEYRDDGHSHDENGHGEHSHEAHENSVEMPAPSFWPMVLAFGLTLLFAGLVTHYIVSLVGLVIGIRAAVGWWRDVIPAESHEEVPVRHPAEWAAPIRTTGPVRGETPGGRSAPPHASSGEGSSLHRRHLGRPGGRRSDGDTCVPVRLGGPGQHLVSRQSAGRGGDSLLFRGRSSTASCVQRRCVWSGI